MTNTTSHRATPEHWAQCKDSAGRWDDASVFHCLLELRARVEALEKGATCPHVVTGDEGTSYCGLAESAAVKDSLTAGSALAGSLAEEALALLQPGGPRLFNGEMQDTLRRALERLQQLEEQQ